MFSVINISLDDNTEASQLLWQIVGCLDAEAVGLDDTYDHRHTLTANRLRNVINDLARLAELLGLTDALEMINLYREDWPYRHFDDAGNPIVPDHENEERP